MKKTSFSLIFVLVFSLLLVGCNNGSENSGQGGINTGDQGNSQGSGGGVIIDDLADDESSYGDDLKSQGAYDGLFEGELQDITVKCISGTNGCYKLEGNVLTFTEIRDESIYSISGKFSGSIVINVGDSYKFDLELNGLSLVCSNTNPITVLSGDEVSIQAKKDTKNYIYDTRAAIDENDITLLSGAIHSDVDLEIAGKGSLFVISDNNNGIHSKKDLQVKNLSLTVSCKDNALKGNDSVELENAVATLIATKGDAIKTSNSDISNKGNQRGTISFLGGSYNVYAAYDGVDAAYNVTVDGSTTLNVFTDKYSNYSEEVISVADTYYIRSTEMEYVYSVKYYNSETDYTWVNADYHSRAFGGRYNYYFYSFPKNDSYSKMQIFVYSEDMQQGQDKNYVYSTGVITPSTAYDTVAISLRGDQFRQDLANFSTSTSSGPNGMNAGNNDKGNHSAKGIKATNSISINSGFINIKSYDDAIHAYSDVALENGSDALGIVNISGGEITIFSNNDGIYADGSVRIVNGKVNIVNSYRGIKGYNVKIISGNVNVISKDDGVFGFAPSGVAVNIDGGSIYVFAGTDGIDSCSRTSNNAISVKGGKVIVISTSVVGSAINTPKGYSFSAGSVVAITPGSSSADVSNICAGFANSGSSTDLQLNKGEYLTCKIGDLHLTLNIPISMSASVVMLGDSDSTISVQSGSNHSLDCGEFIWE